jgi:hypothetical protein
MPFKKTPANILKRGIEYSPVGLLSSISLGAVQLRNGDITTTEFIDKLSAGLTGTAIAGLGWFLANSGMIKIGYKDDKEDEFNRQTGHQEYALEVFGYSVTLDWLVPSAMPMFVGATLYDMYTDENGGGISIKDGLAAIGNIMEPVFNLTMLEGVNRAIEAASYSQEDPITAVLMNAGVNFIGQFFPTIGGQVARTIDPVRRKNYTDKNSPLPKELDQLLNTARGKLPWLSSKVEPYIDIWGEEERTNSAWLRAFENFFSPANINELTPDNIEAMLMEVYKQTGDQRVLPSTPSKYFNVNNERVDLNARQYTQYSRTRGQTMRSVIEGLSQNAEFNSMEPRLKASALAYAIDYANQVGRKEIDSNYNVDGFVKAGLKTGDPVGGILKKINEKEITAKKTDYQLTAADALMNNDVDSLEAAIGAMYELYALQNPDASEKQLRSNVKNLLEDDVENLFKDADDATRDQIADTLAEVGIRYDWGKWMAKMEP